MDKNPPYKQTPWGKVVGITQIIGGIIGIGLLITILDQLSPIVTGLLFFGVLLFAYSIFCGILLIRKKEQGITHSLINQYLQLVGFSISGYSYTYGSGFVYFVRIDLTQSFEFSFYFGASTWRIAFGGDPGIFIFEINFIAICAIAILYNVRSELKKKKLQDQLETLGKD